MVTACTLVAINAATAILSAYLFGIGAAVTMSVIAVLILAYVCYSTVSVDVAGDGLEVAAGVSFLVKNLHLVIAGAFGTLFSFALLSISAHFDAAEQPLLNDIGLKGAVAAVEEATAALQHKILAALVGDDGADVVIANPNRRDLFTLGLALWGGFMAAAMFGPACRYARLLHGMANVPRWGKNYISQTAFAVWTARAAFVLPMLVALLQVRMCGECGWGVCVCGPFATIRATPQADS